MTEQDKIVQAAKDWIQSYLQAAERNACGKFGVRFVLNHGKLVAIEDTTEVRR